MFTGLGKLSSHLNPNLKISPEFLRGFSFHLQPKFPRGFPPPTTKIPGDSPENPRDFARWEHSHARMIARSTTQFITLTLQVNVIAVKYQK